MAGTLEPSERYRPLQVSLRLASALPPALRQRTSRAALSLQGGLSLFLPERRVPGRVLQAAPVCRRVGLLLLLQSLSRQVVLLLLLLFRPDWGLGNVVVSRLVSRELQARTCSGGKSSKSCSRKPSKIMWGKRGLKKRFKLACLPTHEYDVDGLRCLPYEMMACCEGLIGTRRQDRKGQAAKVQTSSDLQMSTRCYMPWIPNKNCIKQRPDIVVFDWCCRAAEPKLQAQHCSKLGMQPSKARRVCFSRSAQNECNNNL